jgi:hypothetical protein
MIARIIGCIDVGKRGRSPPRTLFVRPVALAGAKMRCPTRISKRISPNE